MKHDWSDFIIIILISAVLAWIGFDCYWDLRDRNASLSTKISQLQGEMDRTQSYVQWDSQYSDERLTEFANAIGYSEKVTYYKKEWVKSPKVSQDKRSKRLAYINDILSVGRTE